MNAALLNAVAGNVPLQAPQDLLPAGVINAAGLAVGFAGIAIAIAWWAYLYR